MRNSILCTSLSVLLVINSSCIHTQTKETKEVQGNPQSPLVMVQTDQSETQYLIYKTSELPLNEFFFHLKHGDYKKAFKKMDLRYKPANYDDPALNELIESGFIPVYARVKNTSSVPLEIDEKMFSLNYAGGSQKAFYSEQLPKEFKHFSPKSVAANVYNTGVVVIGFAAVMGAMVLVMAGSAGGNPDFSGLGPMNPQTGYVYNEVEDTVKVDYREYLISKSKLAPGQEAKGLLFFNIGTGTLLGDANLTFTPSLSNPTAVNR